MAKLSNWTGCKPCQGYFKKQLIVTHTKCQRVVTEWRHKQQEQEHISDTFEPSLWKGLVLFSQIIGACGGACPSICDRLWGTYMYLCDVKLFWAVSIVLFQTSYPDISSHDVGVLRKKRANKQIVIKCNAAKMRCIVCFHQIATATVLDFVTG